MEPEADQKPQEAGDFIAAALAPMNDFVEELAAAARPSMVDVRPPTYLRRVQVGVTVVVCLLFVCSNILVFTLVGYLAYHDVELMQHVLERTKVDPTLCAEIIKARVVTPTVLTALVTATFAQVAAAIGSVCYWAYRVPHTKDYD